LKVPSGWRRGNVGRLFEVQLGKMLSKKAKTGKQFPYLANFNIRWGRIDFSRMNKMAFSAREQNKYALQLGDLLVCEGGEVGRCAIWQGGEEEIYYQKALHRVRSTSGDASTEYLYFSLQFAASRGRLISFVGETSIAHLTREKLIAFPLLFPPRPEQKAIADLLSTWDEAIEKTEKLIEAKEKQFAGVVGKLLCNPDFPYIHIREFATEVSIRNKDQEINRVLSVTNRRGFILPEVLFQRSVASSNLSNYKVVSHGQFAYNPSRINVGSIARLSDWLEGVLSPMYVVFWLDDTKVDSDFFLHWLSSHKAKQCIKNSAQGSVRETVSFSDFGSIQFPMPRLEQQTHIAKTLNLAQREIDLLKQSVKKYRTQKHGLMHKILTGTWRVKSKIVNKYKYV